MATTQTQQRLMPADVIQRMVADPPSFHSVAGAPRIWNALPGTLEMIARFARAGDRTLEIGSGASSVVFCAAGAEHVAISPAAAEHERIEEYCETLGLDTAPLSFVAGFSDEVLPALDGADELDLAFIDGSHSFPHPIVDWHYVSRRLRVGGLLLLDDIPIPAVAAAFTHMRDDAGWELVEIADDRAALFRKVAEPARADTWRFQPFNRGYPDFSFAPRHRRLALHARHRASVARKALATRFPGLSRVARRLLPR